MWSSFVVSLEIEYFGHSTMSDNEESNDIEEPVEDDLRLIENDEDGTNGKETKNEETKEMETVKSSSPVVYIALILSSFFVLGIYEV